MNKAQHQLMQIVQKIPVFDGLTLEQAQVLMQAARFKQYEAGDTIYDVGETGDEMLILIKGKVSVLSASGQPLGEVGAGQSTGEMGVFTGHKRSATIVASEECAGLTLTRGPLFQVMNNDRDMKSIILENVVNDLSKRLAEANKRLDVLSAAAMSAAEPPAEEPVAEESDEEPGDDETVDSAEADTGSDESGEEEDGEMPEAENLA